MLLQRREKAATFDKEADMSQLSSWTGESQFNVDQREVSKKKQEKVLSDIFRSGLPDREALVDTIVTLRQEKNHFEEEIRLLKVNNARLKKQLYIAQENQIEGSSRADWLKQQNETSGAAALMLPTDLENSLNENRKLKRSINGLQEQMTFFKVAAEKYQKRAIYVRKKYAQLAAKSKNGEAVSSLGSAAGDDKLRLKISQLQNQLKTSKATVA